MKEKLFTSKNLAIVVICIMLNLGIGFVVAAIKLPFYLDSIGTILATFLLGPVLGVIVGCATVLLGAIYTPTLPAYIGTAIVIVLYVNIAMKFGYLKKIIPTIIGGVLLGIISAIVSAPVTAFVYGGVSFAGADFITSFFRATGNSILESVIYGGLSSDPIDKLLTSVIVFLLIQRIPSAIKSKNR